jgi:hypothetical protein
MNIRVNDPTKIAKNAFRRYMYSSGGHFSTLVE